jgi:hypothetical protein
LGFIHEEALQIFLKIKILKIMSKNRFLTGIFRTIIPAATAAAGYTIGHDRGEQSLVEKLKTKQGIQGLDTSVYSNILEEAFIKGEFDGLTVGLVRKNVGNILDRANIQHGDSMFGSDKALSGRYLVSMWQRGAIGAGTSVLGRGINGDLCSAMGYQRGNLSHPQGYGELSAPIDDVSGLYENGGSRFNKKTGEIVPADTTSEQMAAREIEEELNIKIQEEDLHKINFEFSVNERGIPAMVCYYAALLEDTPPLKNNDEEFKRTEFEGDDMQRPIWVPINKIRCSGGRCHYENSPIHPGTVENLQKSVEKLGSKEDKESAKELMEFIMPLEQVSPSR